MLDLISFDLNFYEKEYNKLNIHETIGISESNLTKVTKRLLGYLKNDYSDLSIIVEIKDEKREVFNSREVLHMVDVKKLYQNVINVRNISIVVSIISLLTYYMFEKKICFKNLFKSFKTTFISILMFIIGLSIYAFFDFYDFWMNFHYLFFTNDLFILDPSKDILIMMVPQQFFMDLVFKIALIFTICIIIIFIVLYYLERYENDKYSAI